jgi:hypothetical protein
MSKVTSNFGFSTPKLSKTVLSENPQELYVSEHLNFTSPDVQMVKLGTQRLLMSMNESQILENFSEDQYGKWRARISVDDKTTNELRKLYEYIKKKGDENWTGKYGKPLELKNPLVKGTLYVQLPAKYVDGNRELAHGTVEKLDSEGMFWDNLLEIPEIRSKNNLQPSKLNVVVRLWARFEDEKIVSGFNFVLDGISF